MINKLQSEDFSQNSSNINDQLDFKRLFLRILQFWPLILIAVLLASVIGFLYMRYTVPVYKISTRVVVNDDSQEGNTNLLESLNANFRNVDRQTEKEIEILRSKTLVSEVIQYLKLNIEWRGEGHIRSQALFEDSPFRIEFSDPNLITEPIKGQVKYDSKKGSILFNEKEYLINQWDSSAIGKIRWSVVDSIKQDVNYSLLISPIGDAAREFRNRLDVSPITKQSSIIDIHFEDEVAGRGVTFLKGLVELHGRNNVEFKNRIYLNTLNFVDERLRLVAGELEAVEGQLESYKSKEGIVNLGEQGILFLDRIKETDQRISELDIELNVINGIEAYVQDRNRSGKTAPATLGLSDPVLVTLLTKLFEAEFEEERLSKVTGPKSRELEVVRQTVVDLRQSILASVKNLKQSITTSKYNLQRNIGKFDLVLKNLPQKEKALLDISRQQQIKNNIYTFLLQKREEAALAAAAQTPNHRIIDPAEVQGKVKPRALLIYTISIFGFLFLASIIIYFAEFNNDKILFVKDLVGATNVPILGELYFDKDSSGPIVVGSGKRSAIAEQIREIRTNLGFLTGKKGGNVVLFTSSISGEGKSFLSLNLAASLAQAGKKVIIAEFDLRKPKLSTALKIKRTPGISNYLIGEMELSEIIKPVDKEEGLFILPSGHIPPNPAELLMSEKLAELISTLKSEYDYVLIDAPPIGSVTDAKILAEYCDSTIFLVRHNYTPNKFIEFIGKQVRTKSLPSMAVVFNGIENKKILGYSYGIDYGYGYGYGYGYYDEAVEKAGVLSIILKKIKSIFK